MKQLVIILFALFIGMPVLTAQELPTEVVGSFKRGDPQQLGSYLDDKAELYMQDRLQAGSKEAVVESLKTFFTENQPQQFNVNHQGQRDESSFIVATLRTTTRDSFRVNCFFKKKNNQYVIHQIRIDKTNE